MRTRAVAKIFIHNNIAYQTSNYKKSIYLGDPLNIAQMYSEQGCQELILVVKGTTSLDYVGDILSVITSPVAVCGFGYKNANYEKLISFGAEKIIVSDSVIGNQYALKNLVKKYGKQATAVSIDYRIRDGIRWVVTGDYRCEYVLPLSEHLKSFDFQSAGELILSNVDLDGSYNGLDFEVASDPLLQKAPMPILLNGGFNGKNTDFLSGKYIDGFVSSRHFCLHGLAPLVNYGNEYAIY